METTEIKPEVYSTKQTLRFIELKVESYAGINKDMTLILNFPADKNITGFSGNQGTGKTSTLRAIMTLLGYEEPNNAENKVDKNKKAELKFEKDGIIYTVNQTKATFGITMESKDGVKSKLQSPKEAITRLVGNVSLSPMDLKTMSGKQQIAWLRKSMKWTPEAQKLEDTTKEKRKEIYNKRTDTNRILTNLKNEITQSGFFDWDKENGCLVATDKLTKEYADLAEFVTDEAVIKEIFFKVDEKRNLYSRAEIRITDLIETKKRQEQDISRIQQEIITLQTRLQTAKDQVSSTDVAIQNGNKFLEENKNVAAEFLKAQQDMMDFSNIQKRKTAIDDFDSKFNLFETKNQEVIKLESSIDEIDKALKNTIKEYTPDIPEFEVETGDAIDNKREEGLYYKGHTLAELSESENWEWFVPFLEKTNTGVVIVENVPSLGTKAVEVINDTAKRGIHVFYSAMQREESKMKVEFLDSIK